MLCCAWTCWEAWWPARAWTGPRGCGTWTRSVCGCVRCLHDRPAAKHPCAHVLPHQFVYQGHSGKIFGVKFVKGGSRLVRGLCCARGIRRHPPSLGVLRAGR